VNNWNFQGIKGHASPLRGPCYSRPLWSHVNVVCGMLIALYKSWLRFVSLTVNMQTQHLYVPDCIFATLWIQTEPPCSLPYWSPNLLDKKGKHLKYILTVTIGQLFSVCVLSQGTEWIWEYLTNLCGCWLP